MVDDIVNDDTKYNEVPDKKAKPVPSMEYENPITETTVEKKASLSDSIRNFFRNLVLLPPGNKDPKENSQGNGDISSHIEKAEKMAKYLKKRGKKF